MRNIPCLAALATMSVVALNLEAAVLYVDMANANPQLPYSDWGTAATNIQHAIDAALPGDVVLVTNGVYVTGGKVMAGDLTNRVALYKAVTVRSVNGPRETIIQGQYDPASTNGPGAARCAWLTNGAVLSGFTLQKGATRSTGYETTLQAGGGVWSYGKGAIVTNCEIRGNSAKYGGGVYGGTVKNSILTDNRGAYGGGSACSRIENSIIKNNLATTFGGGAYSNILNNCTLTGNLARIAAGGSHLGYINNCIVWGNLCLAANNANYAGGTFTNTCTSPLPAGPGNLAEDPRLLSDGVHLASNSPCRGRGSPVLASGVDIDGQAWVSAPAIGCDEWQAEPVMTDPPSWHSMAATGQARMIASVGGEEPFTCAWTKDGTVIEDDEHYAGATTTKLLLRGIRPTDAGSYQVVISNGFGTVTSRVANIVIHCVNAAGIAPAPPYSGWASAATNIQDAIDIALPGSIVLVTNGIYAKGGRIMAGSLLNRVAVYKPLIVCSANGPQQTIIEGQWDPTSTNGPGAVRCVWLEVGAVLNGFTVRGGATAADSSEQMGGGIWSMSPYSFVLNCLITGNSGVIGGGCRGATLSNCVLSNNLASMDGGGSAYSSLNNCVVTGNSANSSGGGASSSELRNCLLTGNSAYAGGGTGQSGLNNCTVVLNSAKWDAGSIFGTLRNCIVWGNTGEIAPDSGEGGYNRVFPYPTGGGNITNEPLFMDAASGDFRLQPNSPCINAGNNAYGCDETDLDGNPRIVGGTVDMGAYECQSPALVHYYEWLQAHGLNTYTQSGSSDPDVDSMSTWREWLAGTDPTNTQSALIVLPPVQITGEIRISWQSVSDRTYCLERATNLTANPAFLPLAGGIPGQAGTTTYTDTNPPVAVPVFYRVGVQQ